MSGKLKRRVVLLAAGIVAGGLGAAYTLGRPGTHFPVVPDPCALCKGRALERRMPEPVPPEGYEKLGPPAAGEWRSRFHEPEQTFESYVKGCANRACPHRRTIYIQPLETPPKRRSFAPGAHERHQDAVGLMRRYAELFFGLPATVLDPIPMFEETLHPDRQQCDATAVIGRLARRLPADALVLIGLTEDDLFAQGLNFVFGEGSLEARTGVYSLRRYQSQDGKLFLRRSLKLLSHEVGHIFSVEHCVIWKCVMQGANSLSEDDSHPMHLCPPDLRKLEWNLGFDRADRYRKLGEFYREVGLTAEAEWVSQRLGR